MLRKICRWTWNFFEAIIVIYVIVITSFILFRNKFGYIQFGQYTIVPFKEIHAEFLEEFKKGDLVIFDKASLPKVGDVIYFYYPSPMGDMYLLKSGKINEISYGESVALYSFSDNLLSSVTSGKVLGKNPSVHSKWGTVVNVLVSKVGFLLLVLLPIMIVFIYQVYELIVIFKFDIDEVE